MSGEFRPIRFHRPEGFLQQMQPTETERRRTMRELQRMADWVCVLILNSDLPAIDIEVEKNKVRERCLELYPDREDLYEMIYESRFQRLWEQFRSGEELDFNEYVPWVPGE